MKVVFAILALCLTLNSAFAEDNPINAVKEAKAKQEVNALTRAMQTYILRKSQGKAPDSLDDCAIYIDGGKIPLDPWGNKYHYDAKGTKNEGKKPDIWVETPGKKVIGNWPTPKEKG